MNVTVIGLGKLGLPMAALYASVGHTVIGVDKNEALVEQLLHGTFRTDEPEVNTLLQRAGSHLKFQTFVASAVMSADIVFVIVPTPSLADGTFTSEHVVTACQQIGAALYEKTTYTLVVIVSTLMPGQMERDVLPALQKTSQKASGMDFGLCYSPEFIALGRVIEGLRDPDYVLIGGQFQKDTDLLKTFYQTLFVPPAPARVMNFVNAELAKLATNAYLSLKIAYANVLAQICEQLPGAHVDVVTHAVGSDHRVGGAYLRAGLPAGGPCLPRDLVAITALDPTRGYGGGNFLYRLPNWNKDYFDDISRDIERRLERHDHVVVLGTAYSTTSLLETFSWGYALEHALKDSGYDVLFSVHDEIVQEQVDDVDSVILALPLDSYKSLKFHDGQKVFDIWRVLDPATLPTGVSLWQLGVGDAQKPLTAAFKGEPWLGAKIAWADTEGDSETPNRIVENLHKLDDQRTDWDKAVFGD